MPLPLAPLITGALGAIVTKVFDFLYQFFAYKIARNLAVGAAAVTVAAGLTLAIAQTIKIAILGARVLMPASMSAFTYFLPSNINQIIAVIVTVKVSHFTWQWSMKNLSRYTQTVF